MTSLITCKFVFVLENVACTTFLVQSLYQSPTAKERAEEDYMLLCMRPRGQSSLELELKASSEWIKRPAGEDSGC
eukprot:94757-Hanusia_phi.AAC.5